MKWFEAGRSIPEETMRDVLESTLVRVEEETTSLSFDKDSTSYTHTSLLSTEIPF